MTSFEGSQSFQVSSDEDSEEMDLESLIDETESLSFVKVPSDNFKESNQEKVHSYIMMT